MVDIVKADEGEEEEVGLSPEVIARLPELVEAFETRRAAVTELSVTLPMNEIEAFAAEMVSLGGEYGVSSTRVLGEDAAAVH